MSSTVCAEQLQLQRFHTSQQKSHHLHNIDVPPRKQLLSSRRSSSSSSPKAAGEEALFRKFLPYNSGYDDDEDDPYSADHFRMFEFKIRRCTRSRSHDWTDCPFAHPGEKARRRDPRRFAYSGTVCTEFRRGGCSKGDSCEFAHGVFECWLHPARYRTEACKDGKNCKRKVCFFAHTPKQLRVLPPNGSSLEDSSSPLGRKPSGRKNHSSSSGCNHCCMICLHQQNCTSNGHNNNPNSPTSTLLNFSPPLSPIKNRESSRFSGIHNISSGVNSLSYDEALAELVASLDVMNVASIVEDNINAQSGRFNYSYMDRLGCFGDQNNNDIYDQCSPLQQQNTQFILSPSTPQQQMNDFNPIGSGRSSSNLFDSPDSSSASGHPSYNYSAAFGSASLGIDDGPDIGWVNELLM